MKAADFIGLMFLARDMTHSVHLNTRSYAKHKALNSFYDEIIGLADTFAEAYQGRHGLIGAVSLMSPGKTANVTQFLEEQLKIIEESRYKVCEKDDAPLQALIDDIVALYLSTLYKLRFLS